MVVDPGARVEAQPSKRHLHTNGTAAHSAPVVCRRLSLRYLRALRKASERSLASYPAPLPSRKGGAGRAVLPHHHLGSLVDFRGDEGRASSVRVVEQHDFAVRVLDLRLRGALSDAEDLRRLSPAHSGLEAARGPAAHLIHPVHHTRQPELVPHRAKASCCRLHVLHRLWILRQPLSHDERAARGIRAGGDATAHEERSRHGRDSE
mmetsp:Transcript_24756/g.77816  ORF Transcript_24756/g.77816 Transcript_24756/m.77816 type:complete len:206 (-) Transcript_24756:18-635(-)